MPAYDFRCKDCQHMFTLSIEHYGDLDKLKPTCPACQSVDLSRLIKRVRILTSEESRIERLSDPSVLANLDYDDPRSMGKLMREMVNEAGEDVDPQMSEVVSRLESGESPESIEKTMDLPDDL